MTRDELIEKLSEIYTLLKASKEKLYADNVGVDLHLKTYCGPVFCRFDLTSTKFYVSNLDSDELFVFRTIRGSDDEKRNVLNDLMKSLEIGKYARKPQDMPRNFPLKLVESENKEE